MNELKDTKCKSIEQYIRFNYHGYFYSNITNSNSVLGKEEGYSYTKDFGLTPKVYDWFENNIIEHSIYLNLEETHVLKFEYHL